MLQSHLYKERIRKKSFILALLKVEDHFRYNIILKCPRLRLRKKKEEPRSIRRKNTKTPKGKSCLHIFLDQSLSWKIALKKDSSQIFVNLSASNNMITWTSKPQQELAANEDITY